MNIYDQILASAYYVFEKELSSQIIKSFISLLKKSGECLNRNENKTLTEIGLLSLCDNHKYRLKAEYTINDIADFIDFDMVTIFHNLKKTRDDYYSNNPRKNEYQVKRLGKKR